jgi:superfamily II DNA or RNA helicase
MFSGLRDYQIDLVQRTISALDTSRRVLVQCPTGGGKTVVATAAVSTFRVLQMTVFFVVHRRELIRQTSQTLAAAGVAHSFIAAGRPFDERASVFVCSVDTLKARLHALPVVPDVVFWDECHHVAAAGWAAAMQRYSGAFHLGLSATPCRTNGAGFREHFDDMVRGPSVASLIEQGHLSQFRVFAPPGPDLANVKRNDGDYTVSSLESACNKPRLVGDAVEHWKAHALQPGKQAPLTAVFGVSVAHSMSVAEAFRASGIDAVHVDGNTKEEERDRLIWQFANGEIQVLTNCGLLAEGFDLAAIAGRPVTIDCAIQLRPTQSLALHKQQVGRVLRPADGKVALILDHAGNALRHGLPDDEPEWSLDGVDTSRAAREAVIPPPLTCLNCYRQVRLPRPEHCPHCGTVMPVPAPRVLEMTPGQLRELKRAEMEAAKAAKAAARAAEKQAREEREAAEKEARRLLAIERRAEERACSSVDELVALAKRRGYEHPTAWANVRAGLSGSYTRNRLRRPQ